jgi:L-ascorbate metabolism protein UlaG (beta-lactamase superfamily)
MLRFCGPLLAGCVFLAIAHAGEEPKGVKITWHGQSFFEIRSTKGTNIVTDPHLIEQYGRLVPAPKADLVLISHAHNDHTQVEALANKDSKALKVILGYQGAGPKATWNLVNETFKDVKVRSVALYHDTVQGLKYGKNTAFVIEVDGWKICHLGDLGHLLSPAQVKQIGPIDVLMIPVGGVYTINGSEAKEVQAQLKPKEYIFPMHYGTPVFDDLLPATEFLEDQPKAQVAQSRDNSIVLNRDAQRPRPLITVLHYWPRKKLEKKGEGK